MDFQLHIQFTTFDHLDEIAYLTRQTFLEHQARQPEQFLHINHVSEYRAELVKKFKRKFPFLLKTENMPLCAKSLNQSPYLNFTN